MRLSNLRIAYPDSFLKLLLIGFAMTMLPLLFAFANAALYLDQLAEQSRKTVHHAVEATRASRMLAEQLTVMERSTRQYLVLGDGTLLEHYKTAHLKFEKTILDLKSLPLDQTQRQQLEQLSNRESALFRKISSSLSKSNAEAIVTEFITLSDTAQTILNANNDLIDRESAVLVATAERAQHKLLWQTLPLVPLAILAALGITFMLTRPIRLMDRAISKLGQGKYSDRIAINGPGDLRQLGERLDWLRNQLYDLEEQKKRFLRHVSHELKTPLTAIREGSELLAEEVGGQLSPQQKEITSILRDSSLRLQKMIENLLNYNAVQFQKPELKIEQVAFKPLIEDALTSHALIIGTKQIETTLAMSEVTLHGDREKLLTIVDNLLSNAVKFTPRGGKIEIHLAQDGELAVFDVADSGPGIAGADRTRLFEPFYRGGGIYDGRISGSGLGLSIAKEYVEAHGGTISLADSDNSTLFRVTLPLKVSNKLQ
jgi:two-component system, NtrC family, sensor histidine kinase GlrK